MLMPADLSDWVPDDHVAWSIVGAFEQMDLAPDDITIEPPDDPPSSPADVTA